MYPPSTLSEAIRKTAECLANLRHGLATGGSTTTLADASLHEPDDWYNGGTLWLLSGALNGKSAVVSDFTGATGTFTIPTQTAAVVAGVQYAALNGNYSRSDLVQAVNNALDHIGPVLQRYDDAGFVVVDAQEEYALPAGVGGLKRVEIANAAAAPYGWTMHPWWMEFDGTLAFLKGKAPSAAGMRIRLTYDARHAKVEADADEISGSVHLMRLAWTAAWYAASNRAAYSENAEGYSKSRAELAWTQMHLLAARYPVQTIQKDHVWSTW